MLQPHRVRTSQAEQSVESLGLDEGAVFCVPASTPALEAFARMVSRLSRGKGGGRAAAQPAGLCVFVCIGGGGGMVERSVRGDRRTRTAAIRRKARPCLSADSAALDRLCPAPFCRP